MDLLTNPKFMITTTYGILAMTIYTGVAYVILKNNTTFKSSFFHLFVVGYFMPGWRWSAFPSWNIGNSALKKSTPPKKIFQNLATYCNSFITLRIPQNTGVSGTFSGFYSSLNANNSDTVFPLSVFHTFHFEFAYTQYIFNCFVCANRFTAICFPINSEKIWLKFTWLIVLSMFVVPFTFFTRHILINHSFFNWSPTANFYIDTTYGRSNIYYYLMPSLILLTLINIVFNILAGIRLYNMKKKGVRVPETSLFAMAFTVFMIDLFLTSLTVSNYYLTNVSASLDSEFVRFLLRWIPLLTPFASDALTLTHPILLLYFSRMTRRKCMESSKFLQKFHNHKFFAESNSGVVVVAAPKNNMVANSSSNRLI